MTSEAAVGECINLGHSEPIALRDMIDLIGANLGKTPNIDYLPPRPEDLPVTYAKLDKARRILGY